MDVVTGAKSDPQALAWRLVTLCRNMTTTIGAMVSADPAIGVTR